MRATFSIISANPLLRKVLPWATLGMVFPALILFNAAFMTIFPAHPGQQGNPEAALRGAMNPDSYLAQTTFIYNTRDTNQLFGNFYYTLGTQLAARGQLVAAETMLNKASHLLPGNPYTHMNYGVVLEALDKNQEAMARYEQSIKIDPKMVQAYYSMGLLQDKMGATDKGIEYLRKAVELSPENSLINYDLGVLFAKKSNFQESAVYSKKALEGGSEFAEAYNNYGYALAQLGRHQEALEAIDKSLALKPDSAAALDSKGFALYGMGRYDEALKIYGDALKADPTIGEIYLHLAQAHEKLGNYDKSIKAYETYLQMTPEATDKAQVEEKIRQLRKWIAADPKKI